MELEHGIYIGKFYIFQIHFLFCGKKKYKKDSIFKQKAQVHQVKVKN